MKTLEFDALVKAVLSGDTLIVTHPTKIPPVEKTVTIAGISAPRFARKEKEEEVILIIIKLAICFHF
jgi:hypothetical protein